MVGVIKVCLLQACQLKRDTISYEEKEQQLVNDCVKELRESDAHTYSTQLQVINVILSHVAYTSSQVSPTPRWCL